MICDKEKYLETVLTDLKKSIEQYRYGEFGFTVTVRDGNPVKIIRTLSVNVHRKSDNLVEIY